MNPYFNVSEESFKSHEEIIKELTEKIETAKDNRNAVIFLPDAIGYQVVEFNADAIKLFLKYRTQPPIATIGAPALDPAKHQLLMAQHAPVLHKTPPVVIVFGNDAPSVSGIPQLGLENFEIKPLFIEKTGREKRNERRRNERRAK